MRTLQTMADSATRHNYENDLLLPKNRFPCVSLWMCEWVSVFSVEKKVKNTQEV